MDSSAPPPNLFQQIHDHDPTQQEEEVKVHGIEHYALQIKETADKLVQGRANRGDEMRAAATVRALWEPLPAAGNRHRP